MVTLLSACPCPDSKTTNLTVEQSNPFAANALEPAQRWSVDGTVLGRIDVGHYVYLHIRQPSGAAVWTVSLAITTPSTPRVRAWVLGRAEHFHSRRLSRDFSPLLFAAVREQH